MNMSHYRDRLRLGHAEVHARNSSSFARAIDSLATDPGALRRISARGWFASVLLLGSSAMDDVRETILAGLAAQAAADGTSGSPPTLGDISLIGYANLASCCGARDEAPRMTQRLLGLRTYPSGLDPDRRWHFARAFAGVALGVREIYRGPAAADVELDELMPFTPGVLYGNNPQALLAHLAAGAENRAPIADVWPAFREVVHNFPYHEEVGDFDGACLFWIARIVHHQIGGQPLGQTADWLSRHFNAWADGRELPPVGVS